MPAATSRSVALSGPKIKSERKKRRKKVHQHNVMRKQGDMSEITMQVKLAFVVTESDEQLFLALWLLLLLQEKMILCQPLSSQSNKM